MRELLGWLEQNKTWVFSGVGVFVLGAIWAAVRWLLRKRQSKSPQRRQAPTPSISYSSCRLVEVSSGAWPKDGIYEGRGSLPLGIAVALAFQNNPSHLAGTAPALNVIAQIVFTKSSAPTRSHVRYGCWLGHPYATRPSRLAIHENCC
jgi:hypothetical protein